MFIVVNLPDEDHCIGAVINLGERKCFLNKSDAINVLKEYSRYYDNMLVGIRDRKLQLIDSANPKKNIRERVMKIRNKIFKILVKGSDIVGLDTNSNMVFVTKYRVHEEIELKPELKFKIEDIHSYITKCDGDSGPFTNDIDVVVYNSITLSSERIRLHNCRWNNIGDVRLAVSKYLEDNERYIACINSIMEDGLNVDDHQVDHPKVR